MKQPYVVAAAAAANAVDFDVVVGDVVVFGDVVVGFVSFMLMLLIQQYRNWF